MYEWDEAKRKSNLSKHGLDFAAAHLVYEHPLKATLRSTRGEEDRLQDFAPVASPSGKVNVLSLVYMLRGDAVRVISLRVASREERRFYEQTQNG